MYAQINAEYTVNLDEDAIEELLAALADFMIDFAEGHNGFVTGGVTWNEVTDDY